MSTEQAEKILARWQKQMDGRIAEAMEQTGKMPDNYASELMATAAGILMLDDAFSSQGIALRLGHSIHSIAKALIYEENESDKLEMLKQIDMLTHLVHEWNWIAAYGPTRY